MTHRTERADASVVAYHRTLLDRALRNVARGYELRAWAVIDGAGELVGPLFQVKCDLCPLTYQGMDADTAVPWWREHWDAHQVDGKHG